MTNETEIWKQVTLYRPLGLCEASSLGRIRVTVNTAVGPKTIYRKQNKSWGGYMQLSIATETGRKNRAVHRLICQAFHGDPPSDAHEASHINGDKLDNRACNLAWKTHRENEADKRRHGTLLTGDRHYSRKEPHRLARGDRHGSRLHPERMRRGSQQTQSVLNDDAVRMIRRIAAHGCNATDLARGFGVSDTTIGRIVSRTAWKHVG